MVCGVNTRMENLNQIFGSKEFCTWLCDSNQKMGRKQAIEIMEQLVSLNNNVWHNIGEDVKRSASDTNEEQGLFDFNPFEWIKDCVVKRDTKLLVDVISLYSSILRRLWEIINLDADTVDFEIDNGRSLHFSNVIVGNYPWSEAVLKAYENFEKRLPRPPRIQVNKWDIAWTCYVRFLNSYCTHIDMNSPMSVLTENYKDHLDPHGLHFLTKGENKFLEFVAEMEEHKKDNWTTYWDKTNIKNLKR